MTIRQRRLTPEQAHRLTLEAEPWLSCDDCFQLVDRYVEQLIRGHEVDSPGMPGHLRGCAACCDEARSLLLLAADDEGLDPGSALRRLTTG
jgi:hypothetical protein